MDAQQILKEIARTKATSIYGIAARNYKDDKLKSAEFVVELYDDVMEDMDSFTKAFGIDVTKSIVRLVLLN